MAADSGLQWRPLWAEVGLGPGHRRCAIWVVSHSGGRRLLPHELSNKLEKNERHTIFFLFHNILDMVWTVHSENLDIPALNLRVEINF